MKQMRQGASLSPRKLVELIDQYTSEHGPAPMIAELARTRRQSATVSFCAGLLCGALLIVSAYAIGGLA